MFERIRKHVYCVHCRPFSCRSILLFAIIRFSLQCDDLHVYSTGENKAKEIDKMLEWLSQKQPDEFSAPSRPIRRVQRRDYLWCAPIHPRLSFLSSANVSGSDVARIILIFFQIKIRNFIKIMLLFVSYA